MLQPSLLLSPRTARILELRFRAIGSVCRLLLWFLVVSGATATAQPSITDQPKAQFAWEGRRVTLLVSAVGKAPFRYQWQFNEADLLGATNRAYGLPTVQSTNEGYYRVIVSNDTGSITSTVARVQVRAWPAPTGPDIPLLARLDADMRTTMIVNGIPGASLAVVKDGRLVLARGYGFAEVESGERFQPDSLCRCASLSKTITATAVMKLRDEGKLDLDRPIYPLLGMQPPTYRGASFDRRWTNITMRQLLYHTAGWDGDVATSPAGQAPFDPTGWPLRIAADLQLDRPTISSDIVQWMLGQPLQFAPGTHFAYSNFGYDLAGVLTSILSGLPYEETAQRTLAGAGITRMRIGTPTRATRAPGEVVYYVHPTLTKDYIAPFEPAPLDADLPYYWPVSLYGADGGWIVNAIDYARLVVSIDGDGTYPDILTTNSVAAMTTASKLPWPSGSRAGMGWDDIGFFGPGTWYKGGGDVGNNSIAYKYQKGVVLVFLVNTHYTDLVSGLWGTLRTSLDNLREWPTHNLFPVTLSYAAWRSQHFSAVELADPTVSGDDADADDDGHSNLHEYASGSDPRLASQVPAFAAQFTAPSAEAVPALTVTYRRLLIAHEVDYQLEGSSDLQSWAPLVAAISTTALNTDGTISVTVRSVPEPTTTQGFYRLRVNRR